MKGQSTAISYDTATDLGTGESGFYSDETDVKFDDFTFYQAVVRDAHTPRIGGLADTSISSGELLVQGSTQGGVAMVENFFDDNYIVQVDVDLNSGSDSDIWVRYHRRPARLPHPPGLGRGHACGRGRGRSSYQAGRRRLHWGR